MTLSRRIFLRNVGIGAAAASAASALPLGESLLFAGEPPRAARVGGPILLNSNENAYGAFPSAHAAMRGRGGVHCQPLSTGLLSRGPAVLVSPLPLDPGQAGVPTLLRPSRLP